MTICEICGKTMEVEADICNDCILESMSDVEDLKEKYDANIEGVTELTNIWGSTLKVNDKYILLEHSGIESILMSLPKTQKTLYYDDFISVEFKLSKFMSYGYIQFNVPGHLSSKEPLYDEYTFGISKKIETSSKILYDKIVENKKKI